MNLPAEKDASGAITCNYANSPISIPGIAGLTETQGVSRAPHDTAFYSEAPVPFQNHQRRVHRSGR